MLSGVDDDFTNLINTNVHQIIQWIVTILLSINEIYIKTNGEVYKINLTIFCYTFSASYN